MELDSKMLPLATGCWLHRSRAICFFALACWTLAFISGVVDLAGVNALHPARDRLLILPYSMGVWFFADLAKGCKQPLERLFYCVGIVYSVISGARAVIPMSSVAIWVCQFLNAALSAIEIALSGAIVLWHFRVRTRGPDSQT